MSETRTVVAECYTCIEEYGPRLLTRYADAKGYDCVVTGHKAAGHDVREVTHE